MSEQRVVFLRKGLVGTCAFVALILLAAFYSTVTGAVERASRQRLATSEAAPRTPALAVQRSSSRSSPLVARLGN
jgi:hypothetical protein